MEKSNTTRKKEDLEYECELDNIKQIHSKNSLHNMVYAITISSAGIYLGYNLCIFNALGKPMLKKFNPPLKPDEIDSAIAFFNMLFGFGKMFGSFLGGILSESAGRKNA